MALRLTRLLVLTGVTYTAAGDGAGVVKDPHHVHGDPPYGPPVFRVTLAQIGVFLARHGLDRLCT